MIDIVGASLHAVATHSSAAYPLVFLAGALTSLGPCAAPRYVTVAALMNAPQPARIAASFAVGLIGAYIGIAIAVDAFAVLWSGSPFLYLTMAAALAIGGLATLFRRPHCHPHGNVAAGPGGALFLGASSALVVSPCCTPVIAAITGLTLNGERTATGATVALAFACGHALPIIGLAVGSARLPNAIRTFAASPAPSIVAGTLMLALAGYYGALA